MAWQIGRQMRRCADWPHARSAAAVGNAESLVQIQVAHIRADVARTTQPHLGIHVGAIHIDLSTVTVDDGANLTDGRLENAMSGRVSDHERGQAAAVLLGFGGQIAHIHIAVRVAIDHHYFHAGHDRAGRVGAVGRRRNEADRALRFAVRPVIGANRQ